MWLLAFPICGWENTLRFLVCKLNFQAHAMQSVTKNRKVGENFCLPENFMSEYGKLPLLATCLYDSVGYGLANGAHSFIRNKT